MPHEFVIISPCFFYVLQKAGRRPAASLGYSSLADGEHWGGSGHDDRKKIASYAYLPDNHGSGGDNASRLLSATRLTHAHSSGSSLEGGGGGGGEGRGTSTAGAATMMDLHLTSRYHVAIPISYFCVGFLGRYATYARETHTACACVCVFTHVIDWLMSGLF